MDNARQWFIEVIMYEKKTRLLLVSLIIVTVILLACEALLGCHFLTSFTVWFILLKATLFSFKTLPMIAFVVEWFLRERFRYLEDLKDLSWNLLFSFTKGLIC